MYKILTSLFFLLFLFDFILKNDAKAACVSVDGVLQSNSVNNSCETQPEIYQVRIYRVMLCTSQPTSPTTSTSSGLNMCKNVISNDTGSVVRIDEIGGNGQTVTGDMDNTIANQTYTWSVVEIDNVFGVQGSFEFVDPYNGEVSGRGNYCATTGNSGLKTSTAEPDNTSICDTSPVSAEMYNITRTSFGGDGGVIFNATVEVRDENTGRSFYAYIIDSECRLSENDNDSDKILAFIDETTTPIIVGSDGNFQVNFGMSEGIGVDGIGGEINFDDGPFDIEFNYIPGFQNF